LSLESSEVCFFQQYFRLCEILTQLSNSLVLWQDFIETRVELEHELTMEQYFLNSIQTNISCNELLRTRLEAEHDLKVMHPSFMLIIIRVIIILQITLS